MSHDTQRAFVARVREQFPDAFTGKRVLEIGSYNVNGTVRDFFGADCEYIGVDVGLGPCVDVVAPDGAATWLRKARPPAFDTIITAEAMEHDEHWRDTLNEAVQALTHGGLLVLTCAGTGRAEHGTLRTSPQDVAPGIKWPTYYRGLDELELRSALPLDEALLYEFSKCEWPADTYFWMVRK